MASGGSGLALGDRTEEGANLPQQVAWGWRTLPMPVIAAVHGVAQPLGIVAHAILEYRDDVVDVRRRCDGITANDHQVRNLTHRVWADA